MVTDELHNLSSLDEAEATPVLRHGLLRLNVSLQQFGRAAEPNAGSYVPDSGKYGGPHEPLCLLAETLDSLRSCAGQCSLGRPTLRTTRYWATLERVLISPLYPSDSRQLIADALPQLQSSNGQLQVVYLLARRGAA